ncbi:MAG: PAS domain S-box protein [Deltaproteobacteria bacterium]|nr:PAS domain S-box protein [Deltaproteobacteria bacterium]
MERRQGPPIVAIGASAGGLEPLEQLFSLMPEDSGMAFVVIQHLDPHHASILPGLLGRVARMPVGPAENGARALADHVYVISPGTELGMAGGAFRARAVAEGSPQEPIDKFFVDLAADQGDRCVGIVMSGSGSDGTKGLAAIRARGGLTIVQAPETAKHDSMPRSAIEAGAADHVLPIERVPAILMEHAGQDGMPPPEAGREEDVAASLGRICEIVRGVTGHDFSRYKRGTLVRRIQRRMQVTRASSASGYVELLSRERQEAELLGKDLLIGVTQFFRDPEAFEHLGKEILPRILAHRSTDEPFRAWVPGCATGEEAYSIGILVLEQLAKVIPAPDVQIFATDIDVAALTEARRGRYSDEIAAHVSPEQLARFFTHEDHGYQVARQLRDACIFSEHSLTRDPPFSGLDLISCRNVFIYLDAQLQKRLIPVFHWALKPGGYLFLGPAEGLTGYPELFDVVDKRHRVFARAETAIRPRPELPMGERAATRGPGPARESALTRSQAACAAFERLVLQEYSPAGAVVNARGEVLCVVGPTGKYLQPPAGILTTNILEIAHAALRVELRTAIHAAVTTQKKIVRPEVGVDLDGMRRLRLTVRPLPGFGPEGLYAIVLEEAPEAEGETEPTAEEREAPTAELESELRTTRADLSGAIEELEATNEELRSANEELQSANEELQTSQEELRSVNEELESSNTELQRTVEELARANSDLKNLISSTAIATVFLDRDKQVTRFTPAAGALLRLLDGDVGRPIGDLAPRLAGEDLAADVDEVLRTLQPIERQVEALDGSAWYMLRVLPYRTVEGEVAGAIVTLVDITRIAQADADLRRLATVVLDSNDAITVQDLEGRIIAWNRGAERMYGYSQEEALQMNGEALVPEEDRGEARGFLEAIRRGEDVASLEVRRRSKDGREIDVWLTMTRLVDAGGEPVAVATTERDVTERKRVDEALRESARDLNRAQAVACTGSWRLDVRTNELIWSDEVHRMFGVPKGTPMTYQSFLERVHPEDRELVDRRFQAALRGEPYDVEHRIVAGGETRWVRERAVVEVDAHGGLLGGFGTVQDITETRRLEEALLAANAQLLEADRRKNEFLAMLSHELRNPLAPIRNGLYILERAPAGGEKAERALRIIDRQVGHMTRLIDDLLDVTRITRGRVQLQRERLDLGELVQRTVEDHRSVFAARGVELQVAPEEVWVDGDRTRLAQIVGNLLQNAVKFTPRGGRTTVSVQADAAVGQAVLVVRDTGTGIAPELLPRVFEPFTQADTSLDRGKGGLGLGLALVKGLVEMHGGSVSAASEGPGTGATFTIRVPLAVGDETTARTRPEPRGERATRRVLVIEDNVDAADSLRDALELGGHSVEVAYAGPEGIEKARAFKPDVVLCDIGLPGMDGYAVARELRADEALRQVRLVALTGYARPQDVAKAREAGFDAHLAKPPSFEALERSVTGG